MSLRATFSPDAAQGVTATWEIHASDAVLYAAVADGQLESGIGPAPRPPGLVITITASEVPSYRAIMLAISCGAVELTGRRTLLSTFARVFTPPQPA
jgi:hypothetical protein